jgi:hypothetical protein
MFGLREPRVRCVIQKKRDECEAYEGELLPQRSEYLLLSSRPEPSRASETSVVERPIVVLVQNPLKATMERLTLPHLQ